MSEHRLDSLSITEIRTLLDKNKCSVLYKYTAQFKTMYFVLDSLSIRVCILVVLFEMITDMISSNN